MNQIVDRIKEAIEEMDREADKLWEKGQNKDGSIHVNIMGLSGGYRNAAGILKDSFKKELALPCSKSQQANDPPIEEGINLKSPVWLIRENINARAQSQMVIAKDDKWFFFDETWNEVGPYDSWIEAIWEFYRYAHNLNYGIDIPSYRQVSPVLNALLGVVKDDE